MSLALPLMLFGAVAAFFGRSSSSEPTQSTDALDALDAYGQTGDARARAAVEEAYQQTSADGGSAYGSASQLAALDAYAEGASAPSSSAGATREPIETREPAPVAPVAPAVPSSELAAREQLAREQLAPSTPVENVRLAGDPSPVSVAPVAAYESPESAARKLHAYIMRTSASSRDRVYIRGLQTAIGVTADGLIGRETARRIEALTGLRIPGLT